MPEELPAQNTLYSFLSQQSFHPVFPPLLTNIQTSAVHYTVTMQSVVPANLSLCLSHDRRDSPLQISVIRVGWPIVQLCTMGRCNRDNVKWSGFVSQWRVIQSSVKLLQQGDKKLHSGDESQSRRSNTEKLRLPRQSFLMVAAEFSFCSEPFSQPLLHPFLFSIQLSHRKIFPRMNRCNLFMSFKWPQHFLLLALTSRPV